MKSLYVVRAAMEGTTGKPFAINATAAQPRGGLHAEYRYGNVDSREANKAEFYRRRAFGSDNSVLSENLEASVDRESGGDLRAAAVDRNPKVACTPCERRILTTGDLALCVYGRRSTSLTSAKQAHRRRAARRLRVGSTRSRIGLR
jgi:hypothetical protein